MVDWLLALLKGVSNLFDDFATYRTSTLYQVSLDGTTFQMERKLNDRFDPIGSAIVITDPNVALDELSIYLDSEVQPDTYFYLDAEIPPGTDVNLYTDSELANDIDFVVTLPNGFMGNLTEVNACVDALKIAPMRYQTVISGTL